MAHQQADLLVPVLPDRLKWYSPPDLSDLRAFNCPPTSPSGRDPPLFFLSPYRQRGHWSCAIPLPTLAVGRSHFKRTTRVVKRTIHHFYSTGGDLCWTIKSSRALQSFPSDFCHYLLHLPNGIYRYLRI